MCYSCWIWIIHVHIYRCIMFWLKWSKMRNKLFIHHIEHECIHVCIILFFYWNELKYLIIFLLKWNKMKELFITLNSDIFISWMDLKNQKREFGNVEMNSFLFISIYSRLLGWERYVLRSFVKHFSGFSSYELLPTNATCVNCNVIHYIVLTLCRKECFTTDYFKGCLDVLLLTDEVGKIQMWIKQLHGADPGV